MHLDFRPEQETLRNEIRAFLDQELPSGWVGIWHQPSAVGVSEMVTKKMASLGWLTYSWPAEYGGRLTLLTSRGSG